jgi:hypothetical protein
MAVDKQFFSEARGGNTACINGRPATDERPTQLTAIATQLRANKRRAPTGLHAFPLYPVSRSGKSAEPGRILARGCRTGDAQANCARGWCPNHDLHFIEDQSYDLVILDPPYSDEEAEWLLAA